MKFTQFELKGKDGTVFQAYSWTPGLLKKTRALFIIIHGMAEHAQRYQPFANFLTSQGFSVYALDLRGHGKTAGSVDKLGILSEEEGWEKMLSDVDLLVEGAKAENPGLSVVLFGHSMGTILARQYHARRGETLAGLILSGVIYPLGLLAPIGKLLTNLEILRLGKEGKSSLLHKMNFGSHNKPFMPARTEFDWLSRKEEEVDAYVEDPFCGSIFTTGFYKNLLSGIASLEKPGALSKIPKQVPIYIYGGEKDPVGKFGRSLIHLENLYRLHGVKDITIKIYKNGRHESNNEINREEVFQDLQDWLDTHILH